MSNPSEPMIGLTLEQIHDLRQLADRLRGTAGHIADQDVWFARYVGVYFARLAVDAATEKLPVRNVENEISTRVIPEVRRATLILLENSLGRKLTPADLLNRLKTAGSVDDAVAEAVRGDIDRLRKNFR
jgi:hypothetical protein